MFTSEPFSSVLITSTVRGPLTGGYAKGILTVLVKKWPKWIERCGIVPNALR